MRITFNGQGTGFGDNGGTSTIFHSANVLHQLGHDVCVVSNKRNHFSWFELDGPRYFKTQKYDYPDADVLIATGVGSVKHVLDSGSKKGLKVWWIRAHETWAAEEDMLFGIYRNRNLWLIVNSVCLQRFISKKMDRTPEVIRPGITLEDFYVEKGRRWDKKKVFTLGALYNERPSKRFKWVLEIYEQLKAMDLHVKLNLFGTYERPQEFEFNKYAMKPTANQLRKFYNSVDFWLAPSKTEGLHIPPQEAMLCECAVVGADATLNGTTDYLEDKRTGFVVSDWPKAVQVIAGLIGEDGRSVLKVVSGNGRKKILELGDRHQNMRQFVRFLESKIKRGRNIEVALRARGVRPR